jgi:hypothetical protein
MALINLLADVGTEYRKLKFGNDRPGGGSSKQPFIQKDLPSLEQQPENTFPDFLLRDPKNQLENRVDDLNRISKFLISREGGLFIAKQELLSLQNPLTQGRPNRSTPVSGLYAPYMTLLQVAGAGTGLHIEKQGLLPIFNNDTKYSTVYKTFYSGRNTNRLSLLYQTKIEESPSALALLNSEKLGIATGQTNILSYAGGPDSPGLGRTRIPFADDRLTPAQLTLKTTRAKITSQNNVLLSVNNQGGFGKGASIKPLLGASNPLYLKSVDINYSNNNSNIYLSTFSINANGEYINFNQSNNTYPSLLRNNIADSGSAFRLSSNKVKQTSINYTGSLGISLLSGKLGYYSIVTGPGEDTNDTNQLIQNSVYTLGNTFPEENPLNTVDRGVFTFNQLQLANYASVIGKNNDTSLNNIDDFTRTISSSISPTNLSKYQNLGIYSRDYKDPKVAIDRRIGIGNPGKRKRNRSRLNIYDNDTVDRINMLPLYKDRIVLDPVTLTRDLVKFRFEVIDNSEPGASTFIHFRAFLGTITDNFNSEWNSTKYIGRGEKFYNYDGFSRDISFTFQVAAQSRAEMRPIYQKLNYLASSMAPEYGQGNFMRGNLIRLTIGDYVWTVPGFITSLTYTIPDNAPWEIAFDSPEDGANAGLLETPMYLDVNVNFTVIHDFAPRLGSSAETAFITNFAGKGEANHYLNSGSDALTAKENIYFFANGVKPGGTVGAFYGTTGLGNLQPDTSPDPNNLGGYGTVNATGSLAGIIQNPIDPIYSQ